MVHVVWDDEYLKNLEKGINNLNCLLIWLLVNIVNAFILNNWLAIEYVLVFMVLRKGIIWWVMLNIKQFCLSV